MTRRLVAVLAPPPGTGPTVPGVDAAALRLAMLEDTYEVVAGLARVEPVVAHTEDDLEAAAVAWPGTALLPVRAPPPVVLSVLLGLAALGGDEGVVVAGDAPDLPGLLIGKLFRALTSAAVAVCPAREGGLVALAAALPPAQWLADLGPDLDDPDLLQRLRQQAPQPRALAVGPGWHRVRAAGDISWLDPGLEGWESTRGLLGGWAGR